MPPTPSRPMMLKLPISCGSSAPSGSAIVLSTIGSPPTARVHGGQVIEQVGARQHELAANAPVPGMREAGGPVLPARSYTDASRAGGRDMAYGNFPPQLLPPGSPSDRVPSAPPGTIFVLGPEGG